MHQRIASFCSAALLCAGLGTAAIAQAQPTSSLSQSSAPATSQGAATQSAPATQAAPVAGTPPTAPATGAQVSDEQLQKFVASAQQVAALSSEYNQRLQQAQGTQSQQQIVAEANERMASAVESSGLTVEEFNGISQAIEQDPQLHARAQQMLPQRPAQ